MKILVFRHVPGEHLGRLEPVFSGKKLPFQYVDLPQAPDYPVDLAEAAGLVFLGGPMSVNSDLPYLRRELYLIERALYHQIPLFGICLGAQLLAKTLGAPVFPNPVKEIGWLPVYPTADAPADPLFSLLGPIEPVFHWHGETFDLPTGAAWLARSDACRHQAFRYGENAYGLQFHIEVTPEMILDWYVQDDACGDAREASGPIDHGLHQDRMEELSRQLAGKWADFARR